MSTATLYVDTLSNEEVQQRLINELDQAVTRIDTAKKPNWTNKGSLCTITTTENLLLGTTWDKQAKSTGEYQYSPILGKISSLEGLSVVVFQQQLPDGTVLPCGLAFLYQDRELLVETSSRRLMSWLVPSVARGSLRAVNPVRAQKIIAAAQRI